MNSIQIVVVAICTLNTAQFNSKIASYENLTGFESIVGVTWCWLGCMCTFDFLTRGAVFLHISMLLSKRCFRLGAWLGPYFFIYQQISWSHRGYWFTVYCGRAKMISRYDWLLYLPRLVFSSYSRFFTRILTVCLSISFLALAFVFALWWRSELYRVAY